MPLPASREFIRRAYRRCASPIARIRLSFSDGTAMRHDSALVNTSLYPPHISCTIQTSDQDMRHNHYLKKDLLKSVAPLGNMVRHAGCYNSCYSCRKQECFPQTVIDIKNYVRCPRNCRLIWLWPQLLSMARIKITGRNLRPKPAGRPSN